MLASIVIPTFNRKAFLLAAIGSIKSLVFEGAIELVIIDDGSADGTEEMVNDLVGGFPHELIYDRQINAGPAAARNNGIRLARGEYIAFTDSDCEVDPMWLTHLINKFKERPALAGVGGNATSKSDELLSRYFDITGLYNTRLFPGKSNVNYLLTLNACFRRSALIEVGGFSTDFRYPGGEDPELCIRLRKSGYELEVEPKAIVVHNHKSTLEDFCKTLYRYGTGKAIINSKHNTWTDNRNLKDVVDLSNILKFEKGFKSKELGQEDSIIFSALSYIQDITLYCGYRDQLDQSLPDQLSAQKVIIAFRNEDLPHLNILLLQLMAVEEGVGAEYILWAAGSEESIELSIEIKKFLSIKSCYIRFGIPDVTIPHNFKANDENQQPCVGNHAPIRIDSKLRHHYFNTIILSAIEEYERFIFLGCTTNILAKDWLKLLVQYHESTGSPAVTSPHLTGKILGKQIKNRFALTGVYESDKIKQVFSRSDFSTRVKNPWWKFKDSQKDSDNANNCYCGPHFSAYDITLDYYLFWKLIYDSKDLNPEDLLSKEAGAQLQNIIIDYQELLVDSSIVKSTINAVIFSGVDFQSQIAQLKVLTTNSAKRLFRLPIGGNSGYEFVKNEIPLKISDLKDICKGQRCFIIGNGPSLKQTDLSLLAKEFTIGFNRIYLNYENMGFEPTFYVAINKLVLEQYSEDIDRLGSIKFLSSVCREKFKSTWNTFFMKSLNYRAPDFKTDLSDHEWHEGWTVTYAGMQLAYYLGFDEVILVGVDHNFPHTGDANKVGVMESADPNHFHPDYFAKGVTWQFPDLDKSESSYRRAKEHFTNRNSRILDATIGGKLNVFPKIAYSALLHQSVTQKNSQEAVGKRIRPCQGNQLDARESNNQFQRGLVTVVVNNFNYARFIDQCVTSVIKQTYSDIEIIIVDDGSTDESPAIISKLARSDDRIVPILKSNGGQASAFNAGVAAARGELICFLDSDDYWLPHKISEILKAYRSCTSASVIQHNHFFEKNGALDEDSIWPNVTVSGDILERYFQANHTGYFSTTSGLAIPSHILAKILPIDESWRICADVPLTRPLPIFGKVLTLSERLGVYRVHDSNLWMNGDDQKKAIINNAKHILFTNDILSKHGITERIDFSKSAVFARLQRSKNRIGIKDVHAAVYKNDLKLASELARLLYCDTNLDMYKHAMHMAEKRLKQC